LPTLPDSIAIAGAWGYIGLKFLEASARLGVRAFVLDPGPMPKDAAGLPFERVVDEEAFYNLDAGVFHLALHPQHRGTAMRMLSERARRGDRPVILNEKPMAPPERPEYCGRIVALVRESGMMMFYDFPELYQPMTQRICEWLGRFRKVRIEEMRLHHSKDRENPANPRNYKVMVPIQYQETVHCIAFLFHVLGKRRGGLVEALSGGLTVRGTSEIYNPPNLSAYPRPVDGKVEGEMRIGETIARFDTNFKSGAPLSKKRVIRGTADGKPFEIEADYLEGKKYLILDGARQDVGADEDSYGNTLVQLWDWTCNVGRERLMSGTYPNPEFTRCAFMASAMLWDSCSLARREGRLRDIAIPDMAGLAAYRPGYF